jgi:hypothetical protein
MFSKTLCKYLTTTGHRYFLYGEEVGFTLEHVKSMSSKPNLASWKALTHNLYVNRITLKGG